jgi:hypothetical protein
MINFPNSDLVERDAVLWITAETGALETQARVRELHAVDGWISTDDRLPEVQNRYAGFSDDVLIIFESTDNDGSVHKTIYAGYYGENKWHSYMHGNNCVIEESEYNKVAYWKPMPKIPKG